MTLAAVAWDIDGTLVDSEPLHLAALQTVCARYGLDLSDLPDDRFRGIHMFDVWDALRPRLPGSLTRDVWLDEILDCYVARSSELRLIDGARAVVAELAAAGVRQVCVSNSQRRIVDANIATLGIGDVIAFSISFDDVAAGKPDPEPYRTACERLGLPSAAVLAVEDSATGALSARRAGLVVLGFSPEGMPVDGCETTTTRLSDVSALVAGDRGRFTCFDPKRDRDGFVPHQPDRQGPTHTNEWTADVSAR